MEILVVDDDPHIRDLLVELLEDEGYEVARASDGEEALQALDGQSELPRLILLDLMMPQMSGWEFREAQRQEPRIAGIPVVTISAHADLLKVTAELDVAEHLAKPIDIDQLMMIVQRYCRDTTTDEP